MAEGRILSGWFDSAHRSFINSIFVGVDLVDRTIKIRWKAISVLQEQPPVGSSQSLFKIEENVGLYSQFGISPDYGYIPLLLVPNIQFYQKMYSLCKKEMGIEIGLKPPYEIMLDDIANPVLFNISNIRLYLPNFLILTLELSNLPSSLSATQLINYQYIHKIPLLKKIIQWTIGMSETLNSKSIRRDPAFSTRPAVRIDNLCSPDLLTEEIRNHLNEYIGILIRNHDFKQMDDSIATRIWEENIHLIDKTTKKKLFVNKQGMMYLTAIIPDNERSNSQPPEFTRAFDLYEIGLFYDIFIEKYLSLESENESIAEAILYKIRPWISTPDIIFRSYSYKYVWEKLINNLSLDNRINFLLQKNTIEYEHRFRKEYERLLSKNTEANDFFLVIKKEILASPIEQMLKETMLVDLDQAAMSYDKGAYKASVILMGAVLEGLMLGTIRRDDVLSYLVNNASACPKKIAGLGLSNPRLKDKIANDLNFEDYKNIINDLIPEVEKMKIEGIQSFRNAVHPWKTAQEPGIYKSFNQSRAMLHLTSLRLLVSKISLWNP
jgi:hypothetical protein